MATRVARGGRDDRGVWHPDDPGEYPPLDVHGLLPWSVLRQDLPAWQARKRHWRELGGGLGVDTPAPRAHAAGMIATGRHGDVSGGVSRFDPVLAELCYRWFCPPGGTVYDPCAGGAVRGLVAAAQGLLYVGVDLHAAQVAANREHVAALDAAGLEYGPCAPHWVQGDGAAAPDAVPPRHADYVLTCPPYHNRERYSDDLHDLSAMSWPVFVEAHAAMVRCCADALRPDRLCTWVIGDVRDHRGHLRGLPALAAQHLRDAGLHVINEQILVSPTGTRHKTMRVPWEACRTATGLHQHVITAVKGDRRAATRAIRKATT